MKYRLAWVVALVIMAMGSTLYAAFPTLEKQGVSQTTPLVPFMTYGKCLVQNNGNPFSTNIDDYSATISVDEINKVYTRHWWGKLVCGSIDNLKTFGEAYGSTPADDDPIYPIHMALGDRKVVVINSTTTTLNGVSKTTTEPILVTCQGVAKDKSVIHCWEDTPQPTGGKSRTDILKEMINLAGSREIHVTAGLKKIDPLLVELATPFTHLLAFGLVVDDADKDGVYDQYDNCPSGANLDQKDSNKDGTGDVCTALPALASDFDQDGIEDSKDKCISDGGVKGTVNADGCLDADQDGIADTADKCPKAGEAGKVDVNGCVSADAAGATAGAGSATAAADAASGTAEEAASAKEDNAALCTLVPNAAPNAGWLLMLTSLIPRMARRRRYGVCSLEPKTTPLHWRGVCFWFLAFDLRLCIRCLRGLGFPHIHGDDG